MSTESVPLARERERAGQGALPLGAAAVPLVRATPSRLAAFADCPRRYRMTYLDRPAPTPRAWAHQSLGAAVHLALARFWTLPAGRRSTRATGDLLDAAWSDGGFRDGAQSTRWRRRARHWVETYVARLDGRAEPAGVERTVAVRTPVLALSGRIDRLDDRDGVLVVVDYKTGRRGPTADDARTSPALALYAHAAAATLRRPCLRVELHDVRTGEVVGHEHSVSSLARQLRRADDIGLDIRTATGAHRAGGDPDVSFPPAPSALCGWCDFRALCPAGAQASAPRPAWDGLGDEDGEGEL